MLIRFSVENFLSFKDEVEFSMLAGKPRSHPHHVIKSGKKGLPKALKAGVIYGANASGKSNLIKAMRFAQRLVIRGTKRRRAINITPFKFHSAYGSKPSKFEFEFSCKARFYNYGFLLDSDRIHEEWLYEITPSTEKMIFERKTSPEGETHVEFDNIRFETAKDREFLEFVARGTRANQLFLTETLDRDVPYFEDVYNWFDNSLVIVFPDTRREGLELEVTDQEFREALQETLQLFDTGISGIELTDFDFEEDPRIPEVVRQDISETLSANKRDDARVTLRGPEGESYLLFLDEANELRALKLMTAHRLEDDDSIVLLEVGEESDGTQRMLHLIPALMELLNSEKVIIIDELDRSLHPHISYQFIELFLNTKPEHRSQLIVTTHESHLLDLDLLRRDEIWFVEKAQNGASSVYSLEEFAQRNDKVVRKDYMMGRYGAIPLINPAQKLTWVK
jgi:hypothetical protein